jgi:hypothetical protein
MMGNRTSPLLGTASTTSRKWEISLFVPESHLAKVERQLCADFVEKLDC